jgi:CarD family transcriptional regulator
MTKKPFSEGEFVVYPAHGVGKIVGYEVQEIADMQVQLVVITFDKDRMILRLPVGKAKAAGLRPLSSAKDMEKALKSLKVKGRTRRAMWSRRAQEHEKKINSGDPASIAEVIRDLHRSANQPDQSYSERQIYQAALDRFVRELAAVEQIDEPEATKKLEGFLQAA